MLLRLKISFIFSFLILYLISCKEHDERFAKKLINKFKLESVHKNEINWDAFERKVLQSLKFSKDSAIVTALTLHNNPHSWYISGSRILRGKYSEPNSNIPDTCWLSGDLNMKRFEDVAYVEIEGFHNDPFDAKNNKKNSIAYINQILTSIQNQDRSDLKAWIIDLRYNSGGDMWPMLISASPFFQDRKLGYFKAEGKDAEIWGIKNNIVFLGKSSQNERVFNSVVNYKIKNKSVKVAVLLNEKTASSGEGLAIALKSLKNAKFFGLKTHGYATANKVFRMGSNESLVLTTNYMYDVKGNKYPNGIYPDYTCCTSSELENQLYNWIYNEL